MQLERREIQQVDRNKEVKCAVERESENEHEYRSGQWREGSAREEGCEGGEAKGGQNNQKYSEESSCRVVDEWTTRLRA